MSTKGSDDGYQGDENDVVYGPAARARREEEERKEREPIDIRAMNDTDILKFVEERKKRVAALRVEDYNTDLRNLKHAAQQMLTKHRMLMTTEESHILNTIADLEKKD